MNRERTNKTASAVKGGKQIFNRFFSLLFFGRQWKSDRETLIFLAKEGLFSLFSAIAAGKAALFGVRPFALPILLCSGTHLSAATLGGCVGTLFSGDPSHSLIVLLFSLGKFLLLRYEQGDENDGKRLFTPAAAVSASLLGALLLQIFVFAREGFRFHSLLALLFSVTANGFFTFLFYGAMEIPEKAAEKTVYRPYRIAGRAALGFCGVYALSGISLFGLPLAAGGGLFLILREAAEGDPFSVVIASLAAGLGCGPRVLPAMLVCGICSCIVRRFQRKYYPSVGLLSAVLTVMYSEGYDALTGTLPSLLAGAAVYMLFSRFPAMQEGKEKTESDKGVLSEKEADPEENSASEVTKALEGLSETLQALSAELRRPDMSEILSLCDGLLEQSCKRCKDLPRCLSERSIDREDLKNKIASALYKKGAVEASDLPSHLLDLCGKNAETLLAECSRRFSGLCRRLSLEDKSPSFAAGCLSAARLLQDSEEKRRAESAPDRKASAKTAEAAKAMGIRFEGLVVRGKSRKRLSIYGISPGGLGVSAVKLQKEFSASCGTSFGVPSIRMDGENGCGTLEMESRQRFSFAYAGASRRKEGENVCGDQYRFFKGKDGSFYGILSDGMGSGRDAAAASGICCAFAEKLSVCGGSPEGIVESINGFLLEQPSECSATVDLVRLDPYSGRGIFVKSGAVPTFVLREGNIFKLSSASMPVGVTREINAEQIRLDIKEGDLIVFASDGVIPDFESGVWLCKLLTAAGAAEPSLLAETILERSRKRVRRDDDASVCVIRVSGCA